MVGLLSVLKKDCHNSGRENWNTSEKLSNKINAIKHKLQKSNCFIIGWNYKFIYITSYNVHLMWDTRNLFWKIISSSINNHNFPSKLKSIVSCSIELTNNNTYTDLQHCDRLYKVVWVRPCALWPSRSIVSSMWDEMIWEYYLTVTWVPLTSNPQIHIHQHPLIRIPIKGKTKNWVPTWPWVQNNWLSLCPRFYYCDTTWYRSKVAGSPYAEGFAVASLHEMGSENLALPVS